MAPLSISNDSIKADGLIARVVDWVFGYDFFLSYSHGDGMRLPRRLKERLEHAGFRVFLVRRNMWLAQTSDARPAAR